MAKINPSVFRAGTDFIIKELGIFIHQPKYIELAQFGDYEIIMFCNIIGIDKADVIKDPTMLEGVTNLQSLLAVLSMKESRRERQVFTNFIELLFNMYKVSFTDSSIILTFIPKDKTEEIEIEIDGDGFEILKEYIYKMFPVFSNNSEETYNAVGKDANKIKEKILEARKKLKERHIKDATDEEQVDLFGRYCLILSVGLSLDYEKLVNCTVFQIISQYNSYDAKKLFDHYIKQLEAGATNIDQVEDWILSTKF